jgi:hypothetical protein
MEVHHHSNSPGNKWSHRFREFLMLFLAVTTKFIFCLNSIVEKINMTTHQKPKYES